ncbi:ribonucleotide-diphosphate reductase (RNR), small subunit [Phanerochaete sordida]|uniref:Ribonucleotide-diphosphate reductase (RNR), small subunit n=1 Tax=Phanerochaete sordida TaxID=48140 RepID=A0A9P3GS03_9APHY|nr:ribonucleotide-diphosphate reductase (RNR), small subunit [Phanerochaete sordida]
MSTPPTEPILRPSDDRLILFPIRYPEVWEMYKKAQASAWTVEEIDLHIDVDHWRTRLSAEERTFVSKVLAFFAASDGIVNDNLVQRFAAEVQVAEIRCFYGFQIMTENVHAEMYAQLLQTLVVDGQERHRLFHAISTIPSVGAKAAWALRWIERHDVPFSHRLVAFAAVEGIFFSSSFAAIFWLRKRGVMPGLALSNEFIARDEGLHTDFACLVFSLLLDRPGAATVSQIIREAVGAEHAFVDDSLSVAVIGMNATMMKTYVEYVADRLLVALGCPKIYLSPNPFDFMELISMEGKTNFFERRVSEYAKAGFADGYSRTFTTNAEF